MLKMSVRFVGFILCAFLSGISGVVAAQDPGTTNVSGNTDVYSSATGKLGTSRRAQLKPGKSNQDGRLKNPSTKPKPQKKRGRRPS